MAERSKIEWTDATVNFWWGCTKVSPGCAHCYADTFAHRLGKDVWGPGKPREDRRAGATRLALKLNAQAEREGRRIRVFAASMSDWLDEEVPVEWLADMLAVIHRTPHLDWQLLSKRPQNWKARMLRAITFAENAAGWSEGMPRNGLVAFLYYWLCGDQPANVWIGATVEDQARADERIPALLQIPAWVRFLSCEPLLGPVNLTACAPSFFVGDSSNPSVLNAFTGYGHCPLTCLVPPPILASEGCEDRLHWVICGGESGPGARPMHPDWARSLRDQCVKAGVPFLFKQWGEWRPVTPSDMGGRYQNVLASEQDQIGRIMVPVGKHAAGRLLDGREWSEFPELEEDGR